MNQSRGTVGRRVIGMLAMALGLVCVVGCEAGPSLRAMRQQGDRAFEQRDYAVAADWYEQYIARRPVDPEVRFRLGTAYLGLKQPVRAREEFLQGLEVDNEVDRYIEGIAAALVETGQRDQLFLVLRQHATRTRQPADYIRFGKFAALVGDPDTAEQALVEAAELDKGQTIAPQIALASFYGSLGDDQRELQRLRMALFINPEDAYVTQRIRELGQIPGPTFALMPEERL